MPKIAEYKALTSKYDINSFVMQNIQDGWTPYGGIAANTDGSLTQVMVKYDMDSEKEHENLITSLNIYTNDLEKQITELRQALSNSEGQLYDTEMEVNIWKDSTERAEKWSRWCPPLFQILFVVMTISCLYIGIENNRAHFLSYLPKTYIIGR